MGWDRQLPRVVQAPVPPKWMRWCVAAVLALLAGAGLFFLLGPDVLSAVPGISMWLLVGLPLLAWVLAFAARAYLYGDSLARHAFAQEHALAAQAAWQGWAQNHLAVHASCVLLPEQVAASIMCQGPGHLPQRSGQARRLASLADVPNRAVAGLQLLVGAMGQGLHAVPAGVALRVTVLTDTRPDQHRELLQSLQQAWPETARALQLESVGVFNDLPLDWVDQKLKTAAASFELLLVVQVQGQASYSDGLAALLLSPGCLAQALATPVKAALLRPMPLDTEQLDAHLEQFFQTQPKALQATALLADQADWQALMGEVVTHGNRCGASLQAQNQWVQEALCGVPGPLGCWLATALAMDVVQHHEQPVLVLTMDQSRRWISTVTQGDRA